MSGNSTHLVFVLFTSGDFGLIVSWFLDGRVHGQREGRHRSCRDTSGSSINGARKKLKRKRAEGMLCETDRVWGWRVQSLSMHEQFPRTCLLRGRMPWVEVNEQKV
eukprot:scaffold68_cov340-Pavlova_lutheri.AAC.47